MSRTPRDLVHLSQAEADRLARLYTEAEREILLQIDQVMARGADLRYLRGMLENVRTILEDLRTGNRQWCEQAIPRIYVAAADYADSMAGKAIAGFGAIHQQAVQVLAENAYSTLESARQVIGRQSEDWYRRYALEATRQSVIGYKSWQEVAKDFRSRLASRGVTGFQDKRGRDWNMKTYSEMVARTTTMEAHLQGTANRLLEHGHDLVRVSTHAGACPLCVPWQGKILSLTGRDREDPRCAGTLEEAKSAGLFHPNCLHAYSVALDLDAEIEALERELGDSSYQAGRTGSSDGAQPGGGTENTPPNVPVAGILDEAKAGILNALSIALEHGLKTHAECLLTLDASTGQSVYNQVYGSAGQVRIPVQLVELLRRATAQSVVSVHNHPSSSSFSADDLGVFGNYESLKGLAVAGHDGTCYFIGRTPETGVLDPRQLVLDWQRHVIEHLEHYSALIRAGQMTEEQAWKAHSHQAVQDVAKEHKLEYVRWSRQ